MNRFIFILPDGSINWERTGPPPPGVTRDDAQAEVDDYLKGPQGPFMQEVDRITVLRRSLDLLKWSSLKDQEIPPVRWLWDPFFPRVPFGILASHPGHGKSLLSLQLAVGIATGLPVFGIPTCGPAGAGVLALEDDKNVIHRRLKAIAEAYGRDWGARQDELLDQNLRPLVRGRAQVEGMDGAAAAHHLAGLAQELGAAMETTKDKPAVLFLDTLNAVHGGDENSNTEVRALTATIFGLHDSLGCSVWALHHLRKAGNGKNGPGFTDRLDPELVRGAGALVGSARAVVQFGWILSNEAEKAGLVAENSHRQYAVMALTKINDGPLSQWMLLEHSQPAGLWVPTIRGDKAIAELRSKKAAADLIQAERLLVDIHKGMTRSDLAAKYWPLEPAPETNLKAALQDLRRRHGWLQKGDRTGALKLTVEGFEMAKELGRQAGSDAYPQEGESEHFSHSA